MPDTLPPGADLETLIGRLTGLGGDAARARHDDFAADLRALLAVPPARVPDSVVFAAAIRHAFAYYAWSWDPRGATLIPQVTNAIAAWAAAPAGLPALLELCDLLYFIGWCFEASNLKQCRLVLPGLGLAVRAVARAARPAPPL